MSERPPTLIIGSGLAGLAVALSLAPNPVILLSRNNLGIGTSSELAQGGIAAAVGEDDAPGLHARDTLAAGDGLCDPAIVKLITEAGPEAIAQLVAWGVAFDRDKAGKLKRGLEGAHGRRRIVHAHGDGTGATIVKALTARARNTPSIRFLENVEVVGLMAEKGCVVGVRYRADSEQEIIADNVVLATGGAGALWQHTTNPMGSWGHGLALAARAGAALRDLEFMQFHPTAMDVGLDPMPLASEALRGEGAVLVNDRGARFMANVEGGDLAPRDIVARAIWAQIQAGRKTFLDARGIESFAERFPTIHELALAAGIEPQSQRIPICPAAHYHMGGVAVDADGRTSIAGLWACGEVAATGLHGANRLASNSLLEAVVMGKRVARGIRDSGFGIWEKIFSTKPSAFNLQKSKNLNPESRILNPNIRALMAEHVGVLRDATGLNKAIAALTPMAQESDMALVALRIAEAALARKESIGAHWRVDFS